MSARQIAVLISCSHDAVNRTLKRFRIGKSESKTGPLPFGWKLVRGKRVQHAQQQIVLAKIAKYRLGKWWYSRIADKLNKLQIPQ
jgi:hypothetical protein